MKEKFPVTFSPTSSHSFGTSVPGLARSSVTCDCCCIKNPVLISLSSHFQFSSSWFLCETRRQEGCDKMDQGSRLWLRWASHVCQGQLWDTWPRAILVGPRMATCRRKLHCSAPFQALKPLKGTMVLRNTLTCVLDFPGSKKRLWVQEKSTHMDVLSLKPGQQVGGWLQGLLALGFHRSYCRWK